MSKRNIKMDDGVLHVIHDNNIVKFLKNLELFESLEAGEINCKFCKEPVQLETINGIFPESGSIKISCNKPKCVVALTEYLNERDV